MSLRSSNFLLIIIESYLVFLDFQFLTRTVSQPCRHPYLTFILNLLVRPVLKNFLRANTSHFFSSPTCALPPSVDLGLKTQKKTKKNPLFKICLTRTYILTQTHSFLLSSLLSCLRFTRVFPLYCLCCVLVVAVVCCVSLFSPYDYY